jgi:hypothetical protein
VRYIFFFFIAGFICNTHIFAQSAVTINENGAYYINRGIIKKIPSDTEMHAPVFWRNYIVFLGKIYEEGFLIYNTDNDASSNFLETGNYWDVLGAIVPVEKGKNLCINLSGLEYELDPVTLKTIKKTVVIDRTLKYDWRQFDQYIGGANVEFIQERTIRYHGEKYYTDVTFGNNVNISNRGNWSIQGGKNDERFVLVVTDYTYPPK